MTKIAKRLAITILLGTASINASRIEDYALTKEYKLLNDMKLAQKQQELILKMGKEMEAKIVDIKSLNILKDRFERVLNGLIHGDRELNLKGTNLSRFKTKLVELKELWKKESKLIQKSIKNRELKDKVVANLNSVMLKMSELIDLYNKSYSRFKQKSKISSIVYRHISNSPKKHIALNVNYHKSK